MKGQVVKFIVLIGAITLIGIGVFLQQYESVIAKAINICLECIGIG